MISSPQCGVYTEYTHRKSFDLWANWEINACIFTGDELIAEDDDKQQLLNYMIQVCRPKDWQISLLEDRLARQLAISGSSSQKRLDRVLNGRLGE